MSGALLEWRLKRWIELKYTTINLEYIFNIKSIKTKNNYFFIFDKKTTVPPIAAPPNNNIPASKTVKVAGHCAASELCGGSLAGITKQRN